MITTDTSGDVSPLVGVKLPVKDYTGDGIPDTIVSVITTPVDRPGKDDLSPSGQFWGFEPIPGFFNPDHPTTGEVGKGVAMSHLPDTWPSQWPDYPDWTYSGSAIKENGIDVTPKVDWNGYFGRGQMNADQESYFWMDDNPDEKMFSLYGFTPDSTDPSRRGQGIQVSVRGLQWANFLAQDVIFWVYKIKNDGTTTYDQTVFGTLVGTYVGGSGDEYNDDASFFDIREAITYTWDFDHYVRPTANPKWLPNASAVGYISYGFLESPGNGVDGIDNDGDNSKFNGSAKYFTADDFNPHTVKAGDKLILIDKNTFKRTAFTMPNDTVTVQSMGVNFFLKPDVTVLQEGNIDNAGTVNPNAYDGIDNNLNGLIDESYIVHYRQYKKSPAGVVLIDTLSPVQHFDYVNGVGLTDPMIDEKRDDGIDNDKDWTAKTDDVGADGKAGTHDFGEGDGIPTAGEPDFEATDVHESDQLGLTSFQYFTPASDIKMSDENAMWRRLKPGYFDVPTSVVNNVATKGEDGDFIYGSGYFPLLPGKVENFSLEFGFGDDYKGVIKTKRVAQMIYNANYNFPKPPDKPTLTVVPGDKKVTLIWDKIAENSIDPTTKEKDFEGYKIYKGTDADFTDAHVITDGSGSAVFYKPLEQFDLADGITGYFVSSSNLYDLTSGAPYYLGSDNGVKNSYVDNDVINGRVYYYAVVAYDRGKTESDIFPSENTKFISKDATGLISTDINTAVVTPNAPVAGYVAPASGKLLDRAAGYSTAVPYFEVVNPVKVKSTTYEVTFKDSLVSGISIGYAFSVRDTIQNKYLLQNDVNLLASNGDVFDGLRLSFNTSYQKPDSIKINQNTSGWKLHNPKDDTLKTLGYSVIQYVDNTNKVYGSKFPRDYAIVFNNDYKDSSNNLSSLFKFDAPAVKNINFKIYDVSNVNEIKQIKFMFFELNDAKKDTLSNDDVIVCSDPTGTAVSWELVFSNENAYVPKAGDTLLISFIKPFNSTDRFVLTTNAAAYDANLAKGRMDRIKVVPNPYVSTNVFEQSLPSTIRGRGERVVYFTNLPVKAKIHIFSSSGDHVRDLEHAGDLNNGTVSWDLRTKEGLDVAYGVYFYIVEAPGFSDKKFGKIALIK